MINRRTMLRGLSGLAITPLFLKTLAAEEASANSTIVVGILLAGGNDGLNTVIPLTQYGAYARLRTPATPPPGLALAYAQADLAPLAFNADPSVGAGSATAFAFAPGMNAMRALYATGHLAVIAGVGLPKAETNALSHVNGQLDWLTGQINVDGTPPAGWLGAALDNVPGGLLGPSASLGGSTPLLTGNYSQALVINPPMEQFGVSYGATDDLSLLKKAYRGIVALPTGSATAAYNQGVLASALGDIKTVRSIAHQEPATNYPTPTWLDQQLREIARLITGGSGIRGYYAVQGGYDSHSAQAQTQPLLVQQLSNSLSVFYAYLQAKGASSNVVIMTMSDFGRRPAANLDFGTDHGCASVSFVLGDQVTGGTYGKYPSLTHFDENENLKMNVDFRNVLSDVIVGMGGNAAAILGQTWPSLGFI